MSQELRPAVSADSSPSNWCRISPTRHDLVLAVIPAVISFTLAAAVVRASHFRRQSLAAHSSALWRSSMRSLSTHRLVVDGETVRDIAFRRGA